MTAKQAFRKCINTLCWRCRNNWKLIVKNPIGYHKPRRPMKDDIYHRMKTKTDGKFYDGCLDRCRAWWIYRLMWKLR